MVLLAASVATDLRCPACEDRRALLVLRRRDRRAECELWYCTACFGFWVAKDILRLGVSDSYEASPGLVAGMAPARCKSCFGHLKPDGACAKCGKAATVVACPGCMDTMGRNRIGDAFIDLCPGCGGAWFDTGEIAAVYGLRPLPGLAMSTVEGTEPGTSFPIWIDAILLIARVFLPI